MESERDLEREGERERRWFCASVKLLSLLTKCWPMHTPTHTHVQLAPKTPLGVDLLLQTLTLISHQYSLFNNI